MPIKTKQQNKKIPRLRFPEFSGEWEEKRLGEVCEIRGGKRIPKGYSLQEENNGHPYITVSDMQNDTVDITNIKYVPIEVLNKIKKYTISTKDIFVSVAGTLGIVGIIPKELEGANLTENADKLTNIKCNQFYLLHYLKSGKFLRLVNSVKTENAQPKLAIYALKNFKIFIPSLPEQQKIASFLNAVDERIGVLRKKREALTKYKKSIMQKIFSQEIRFEDDNGKDFPEWKEKRLGEVCKKESSNISVKALENNIGDYKIYGANGVFKKVDFYQQEEGYISIVKDGAGVGRVFFCEPKTSVLGTLDIIKPKNQINLFFLYLLLQRIKFIKYVTGSTIPHIYFKDYSKLKIKIPPLPEQQKIANFLFAIDKKIELVGAQIQKMQEWKRGLMQGLFV